MDIEVFRTAALGMFDRLIERPMVLFGQDRQIATGYRAATAVAPALLLQQLIQLSGVIGLEADTAVPVDQERINRLANACFDSDPGIIIQEMLVHLTNLLTTDPYTFALMEKVLHVG